MHVSSIWGSTSEAKNIPITMSAEYSDYTNVFSLLTLRRSYPSTPASIIILWAWYMIARQRSNIVHPQEGWKPLIVCDYRGLNNLTIKNQYPLPWIEVLPSWSKCQFQRKEVCFLGYVMSSHVALTFRYSSNFYQRFI